jgi:lipid-A-disaccharide synthase-like uncharacterized protein
MDMNITPGQFLEPWLQNLMPWLYTSSYWWTFFGFVGNLMFSSRFLLQWLASEKTKRLVVPAYFWHLSFWGSVFNCVYAFHIDNAPIIFGVFFLPFIYGRNLVLLRRTRGRTEAAYSRSESIRPALKPA